VVAGAEESALGDADVCGDGDGREIEDEHLLAEPNVVTPFKPPRQPDVQRERMTAPCPIRTPNRRSNVTHNAEGQGQGERKKTARTSTQSASLKREAPRSKLELSKRLRSMGGFYTNCSDSREKAEVRFWPQKDAKGAKSFKNCRWGR